MTLTLIVETGTGLSNANSYATVAEGDAYHEAHLYASAWTGAVLSTKTAALVWATRLLDEQVQWYGYRATVAQALSWPRGGVPEKEANADAAYAALYGYVIASTVIPTWLKYAVCEYARQLIEVNRTTDVDTVGYSQITVGPISLTIDKADKKNIVPDSVMSLVSPYGDVQQAGGIAFASLMRA